MIVGRGHELELGEDAGNVGLDRLRREKERVADRLVRATLGHQRENLALTLGQVVERHPGTPSAHELGDDLWVDDGATAGDPPDRIGEIVEVVNAVLEQVADAACTIGDQAQGEGRLDVLRQNEDPDARAVLGADRLRGAEALVRVGRRHPDVDDRDIGLVLANCGQERGGVADLGDDLEACFDQQSCDPFAEKDGVIGKDNTEGHVAGTSARIPAPDS
jgi:hypothetical protein